jgi:hypothetical protein
MRVQTIAGMLFSVVLCVSGHEASCRLHERAGQAGMIEAALRALRAFPHERALLQHLCCAIGNACVESTANQARAGAAGAIELATAALRALCEAADAAAAEWPLGMLQNVCRCEDANGARAVRCGALSAIVAVMRAYPKSAALQARAASTLSNVVALEAPHRVAAGAAGAVPALLSALRAHRSVASVQEAACHALGKMCIETPPNQVAAAAGGGVESVCAALRAHPRHREAQREGCYALACMCDAQRAHIIAAGAAGAIELVLSALSAAPPGDADAAGGALQALFVLMPTNEARARAAGAVLLVVAAMRAHSDDTDAITYCCGALGRLVQRDGAMRDAIGATGAIEAALSSMLRMSADEDVQSAGYIMLHALCNGHEGNAARAVRAGALEVSAAELSEEGLSVRAIALQALRDAKKRHDAAAPDAACVAAAAAGGCRQCATLRARGVLCALAGCGVRRDAPQAAAAAAAAGDAAAQGGTKLRRCGACKAVAYCCGEHQRGDWARHKGECAALAAAARGTSD